MSWLGKLFGKPDAPAQPPVTATSTDSPLMEMRDAQGRRVQITREEWRTKVLPANFRKCWNDPQALANLLSSVLTDGFIAECLEPARQLARIDPEPKRAANYLAVVHVQLKQFAEAQQVINDALQKHGPDGVLLTNLAQVYSGQGDEARSETTLWQALEAEPNFEKSVTWYADLQRARGGEAAYLETLRRIAALPKSWRAQLLLAEAALNAGHLEPALAQYRDALARVGKTVPVDLLRQMSGDLGNSGQLASLVALSAPVYDPRQHGPDVGNNLIKAYLDLSQTAAARAIWEKLHAMQRPDWKQLLDYWEAELRKHG